jgi:hypothetical protein
MATAEKSKDHGVIREWIEARGGTPSRVSGTDLLRVDFGEKEESFDELSWNEFFEIFDREELTFLYDPEAKSRFNKFISGDEK